MLAFWFTLSLLLVGLGMVGAIKLVNRMRWKHPEPTPMFLNRRKAPRNQSGLADNVTPADQDEWHTVERD